MTVTPFLHDREHGIFSTRAPSRPNPIGLSVVELTGRDGLVLHLGNVDVLDGTPLLDIKPYVVRFDLFPDARCGWQDEVDEETAQKRGLRGYRSDRVSGTEEGS
jgi:tRNA (Thr-GGU) A37 N-methylase